MNLKRFPEHQAADAADKITNLLVAAMASHENETAAEMRFHFLDSDVKHISREIGHEHVEQNDIEFLLHDFLQAFLAVLHTGNTKTAGFKMLPQDIGQFAFILEHQNVADFTLFGEL